MNTSCIEICALFFFDKEMKKINDIVKGELSGNKQLIDNLNHKIGVVEKVIKAIVLNEDAFEYILSFHLTRKWKELTTL